MPKISFITVNYNSVYYIKKLLESFKNLKCSKGFEIIIIDNASCDESIKYIKEASELQNNIILIKEEKNYGFAKASNIAAGKAAGEYLVFLNPDTVFIDRDLDILIDFFESKKQQQLKTGLVGVKTLNEDGALQLSCRSFPTLARQFFESFFLYKIFKKSRIFGSYFMTYSNHELSMQADWVSGSFMLIKKSLFNELGGFDEDYFMYSEDADLCLKLQRKGFKTYYFADFKIMHYDGALANKNKPERIASIWNSRYIYFNKNYGIIHAKALSILFLKGVILRILVFSVLYMLTFKKHYRDRVKAYGGSLALYYKRNKDSA